MDTTRAQCAGCAQTHYEATPPRWWGLLDGRIYCILCCAIKGIETRVEAGSGQ